MTFTQFFPWLEQLAANHYLINSVSKGFELSELGNAALPAVFIETDVTSQEVTPGVDQFVVAFNVVDKPERSGGVEWTILEELRGCADDLVESVRQAFSLKQLSPQSVALHGAGDARLTGWRYEITINLERTSRVGLADRFDPAYVPPVPSDPTPTPLPSLTAGNGLVRVDNQILARLGDGLSLDAQGRIQADAPGGVEGVSQAYVDGAIDGEAAARASADSLLSDLLSNEVAARSQADLAATESIASEATTRASADATQVAAITAETNARVAADAALSATIASIIGMAPEALDTLAEIAARIIADEATLAAISASVGGKVDKLLGYGLSKNDLTDALVLKLAGIAAGATVNSPDATLLARANHTGTQDMATIIGLAAALVAKADTSLVTVRNLYQTATAATVPAVTAESVLASYRIPAGTLSAGKRLNITGLCSMAGAGGNRTISIRLGNTTTMLSALVVRQVTAVASNASLGLVADVFFDTATTGVGYNTAVIGPYGTSGAVRTLGAVDTSQDLWLYVTGTKAVASDTITLVGLSATAYL